MINKARVKRHKIIEQSVTKSNYGANEREVDECLTMMVVGNLKKWEKDIKTNQRPEIPEMSNAIFERGNSVGETINGKLIAM